MTEKEYNIILNLFHEFNEDFYLIRQSVRDNFYDILYGRKKVIPVI